MALLVSRIVEQTAEPRLAVHTHAHPARGLIPGPGEHDPTTTPTGSNVVYGAGFTLGFACFGAGFWTDTASASV